EGLIRRIRVLIRVPECAAIWIKRHGAVIAPASRPRLRGRAGEERLFGLAECVYRVGGQPTRVHYRRKDRRARGAVTHGHVAGAVEGQAGHKAMEHVRAIGIPSSSLRKISCDRAASNVHLVPTWRS